MKKQKILVHYPGTYGKEALLDIGGNRRVRFEKGQVREVELASGIGLTNFFVATPPAQLAQDRKLRGDVVAALLAEELIATATHDGAPVVVCEPATERILSVLGKVLPALEKHSILPAPRKTKKDGEP